MRRHTWPAKFSVQQKPPLSLAQLQPYLQLIRADNQRPSTGYFGGLLSSRLWRFSDMRTRLEFLLGKHAVCFEQLLLSFYR